MTTPTGVLFSDPQIKPLSTVGLPQAASYYLFFLTGTTTPTNVYADGLLATPLSQTPGASQPSCTADSAGRFNPIYLNPATVYRVQLFTAGNVKLEDTDPYVVPGIINFTQAAVGAILFPQTAVESAAHVTPSNFAYQEGNALRYGLKDDNATDNGSSVASIITLAEAGIDIYFPLLSLGIYLTSVPFLFTTPANMHGDPGVRIKLTTTQNYIIKFDYSGTGAAFNYGGKLHDLILDGASNAADGLYLRNVINASFKNVRCTNISNAGLHLAWGQLCIFENYICSNNVETMSKVPNYGILIDNANTGGASSANLFSNPTLEGLKTSTSGIGIDARWAINSVFLNGTSEGNQIGIIIGSLTVGDNAGQGNKVIGMDVEANTVADLQILGGNTFANDIIGGTFTSAPAVTFTASVGGASGGTLTAAIVPGTFQFTFSDAEIRQVTVAANGLTCTWTTALSAGSVTTATLGNGVFVNGAAANRFFGGFAGGIAFDSASQHNVVNSVMLFGNAAVITDNGGNNVISNVWNVSSGASTSDQPARRRGNFVVSGSAAVAIDCSLVSLAAINYTASGASTITVSAPTNQRDAMELDVTIHNQGAGAITMAWNAIFKIPSGGVTLPANGFNRNYKFKFDSNFNGWYLQAQTAADVTN